MREARPVDDDFADVLALGERRRVEATVSGTCNRADVENGNGDLSEVVVERHIDLAAVHGAGIEILLPGCVRRGGPEEIDPEPRFMKAKSVVSGGARFHPKVTPQTSIQEQGSR